MSKIAIISYWKNIDDLREKLREYDAIFATDNTSKQLLEAGIEIEAAIADFDSVNEREETINKLQLHTKVIVLDEAKDMSDTEAALIHAVSMYPDAKIDLYNDLSGRLDHTLALLSLFQMIEQPMMIISPSSQVEILTPGRYEIEPIEGYKYLSFIALEPTINIELQQLKYPVSLTTLKPFSSHLISNEFLEEKTLGIVQFDAGLIPCIYAKDN